MVRKYDRRLMALEKILNRPLPPKILLYPRYYGDGRPLPPEIIAMYKRGLTQEEALQFMNLSPEDEHVFLSPEEYNDYMKNGP